MTWRIAVTVRVGPERRTRAGLRVHGLSCAAAGGEPAGVGVGGCGLVGPIREVGIQESGSGSGVTETERGVVPDLDDVIDREPDDPGDGLGEEQEQRARDAGGQTAGSRL